MVEKTEPSTQGLILNDTLGKDEKVVLAFSFKIEATEKLMNHLMMADYKDLPRRLVWYEVERLIIENLKNNFLCFSDVDRWQKLAKGSELQFAKEIQEISEMVAGGDYAHDFFRFLANVEIESYKTLVVANNYRLKFFFVQR